MNLLCWWGKLTPLILLALLSACAATTPGLRQKADMLAAGGGMHATEIPAGNFTLLTYERISDASASVHIYIEGDGTAWLTGTMVSPDPTPRNPVALELALRDPAPNVVYMARVCQYIMTTACSTRYWTYAQYNDAVIADYSQAMNRWQGHKLELTGYSGGAAVALLVAARRGDVSAIRTVAGNVDTEAFTTFHNISPYSDSMNPAAIIERTAKIPQRHFAGEKDRVIPPLLVQNYQEHLPPNNCSAYDVVPGLDHHTGWPDVWPQLLAEKLPCQ